MSVSGFLNVIPQSRTNRRRNEPCEFAYAVPLARRSQSPMNYNVSINQEITDSRLHTALRSVSLVCFADAFAPQHSKQVCSAFGFQSIQSGFRNDFFEL